MMSRQTKLLLALSALLPSAALVSCNGKGDPGLTERVALLEAELRERDTQITALQEEASQKSEAAAEPSAREPDLKAAKSSYPDFVEALRKKLAAAIPSAKFERPSIFPVEGPDAAKPIVSRVSFRISATDGRSGEIVIPIFADPSGQWQEPETDDIVAGYKARLSAPPTVATNNPPQQQAPTQQPQQPPTQPQRQKPTDVMGANRTVEVEWNDGPKPAQRPPQQQAPQQAQPPAQPPQQQAPQPNQPPATPKKVMPTSRDVIIDFE